MKKEKRPPRPKATSAEVIQRKIKVEEWLRDCLTRQDIVKNVINEGWKISTAFGGVLDQYIHEVKENWKELAMANSPYNLEESVQRKVRLYHRTIKKGDLNTARALLADLDKVQGLIVDKGIQGQVPIGSEGFELTDEETVRLAKELNVVFKKKG